MKGRKNHPPPAGERSARSSGRYRRCQGHLKYGDGRPAPFRFASGKAKNLIRPGRQSLTGLILSILLILSKRTMEKVFNSFKGLTGSTGFSGSFSWSFPRTGERPRIRLRRRRAPNEAPGDIAGIKVIWSMAIVGRALFASHPEKRKIIFATRDVGSRGLSCQSCKSCLKKNNGRGPYS